MSKKLKSTKSKFAKIKRQCVEQSWLIILFAPLLFVAILAGEQDKNGGTQVQVNGKDKSQSVANIGMQITSIELAAIVTKPIEELVVTEVYFGAQHIAYSKQETFNINHSRLISGRVTVKESVSSLGNVRLVNLMVGGS